MGLFQNISQRASSFVNRVKEGMDEKEAELHQQYSSRTLPRASRDPRPPQSLAPSTSGPSEPGQTEARATAAEGQQLQEKLQSRIARDQALGKDFFA